MATAIRRKRIEGEKELRVDKVGDSSQRENGEMQSHPLRFASPLLIS